MEHLLFLFFSCPIPVDLASLKSQKKKYSPKGFLLSVFALQELQALLKSSLLWLSLLGAFPSWMPMAILLFPPEIPEVFLQLRAGLIPAWHPASSTNGEISSSELVPTTLWWEMLRLRDRKQ